MHCSRLLCITTFFVSLITALILQPSTGWAQGGTSPTEKAALVALYNSTVGANWTNKTGWENNANSDPCSDKWYGVTCDTPRESYNIVTKLDLHGNNLTGTIPAEIGNLTELTELILRTNNLIGTIPAEIGNLTLLESFTLYNNSLTGNIPIQIGNLTQLTSLILSGNSLDGNIPAVIGNLTQLVGLNLAGNSLNGNIPAEIGKLTQLTDLNLFGNSLSGNIPAEIGKLTQLLFLNLSTNSLDGNIPTEIGNLTLLGSFYLRDNQLCGPVPESLASQAALMDGSGLDLNGNNLDTDVSTQLDAFITLKSSSYTDWTTTQGSCFPWPMFQPAITTQEN